MICRWHGMYLFFSAKAWKTNSSVLFLPWWRLFRWKPWRRTDNAVGCKFELDFFRQNVTEAWLQPMVIDITINKWRQLRSFFRHTGQANEAYNYIQTTKAIVSIDSQNSLESNCPTTRYWQIQRHIFKS